MQAARRRPPHRSSLKLPTAVHQTDRPGKKFAEIAGQILGKAEIIDVDFAIPEQLC